jgi:hypothetical protein
VLDWRFSTAAMLRLFVLAALALAAPVAQSQTDVLAALRADVSARSAQFSIEARTSGVPGRWVQPDAEPISLDRSVRSAAGGWLLGAVVGGTAGYVVGYASGGEDEFFGREGVGLLVGAMGAFVGSTVGAPVGVWRAGGKGMPVVGVLASVAGQVVPVVLTTALAQSTGGPLLQGSFLLIPLGAIAGAVLSDRLTSSAR